MAIITLETKCSEIDALRPNAKYIIYKSAFGAEGTPAEEVSFAEMPAQLPYPLYYIVHSKDDPAVPYLNSVHLEKLLNERNIPNILELALHASHGFGEGRGTDADGWYKRAIAFEEGL